MWWENTAFNRGRCWAIYCLLRCMHSFIGWHRQLKGKTTPLEPEMTHSSDDQLDFISPVVQYQARLSISLNGICCMHINERGM